MPLQKTERAYLNVFKYGRDSRKNRIGNGMEQSQKIREQMESMILQLNQAADAYYNGHAELMSDTEWDALFDSLKELEEKTGIILQDSPTNRVSEDTMAGQKEEHEFPMLSLAKTKSVDELVSWMGTKPVWLSWKEDGLTLVCTWDNGKLTKVLTRGNGHIGTNITNLASAIDGILPQIEEKGHFVVRGECLISYTDFNHFLLESDEEYANPRNLASGSLTLKDINEIKRRHLTWKPFTLVYTEKVIRSWGNRLDYLESLGMKPVERRLCKTEIELRKGVEDFTKIVESGGYDYPVDGLVIAYDDTDYAATGSVTGHHATRAGLAFKWQDKPKKTVLKEVEWSCSANTINPVAVFEPVEIAGTTVRRASLCNISECRRLDIGGAGTEILVTKQNLIIPKVVGLIKKVGALDIPKFCPVCGKPTQMRISGSGAETLFCTNEECTAKKLSKFTRFVSKEGMNIDGISEASLASFIREGLIHRFEDIFRLEEQRDKIEGMEGFGEKSFSNLVQAIEAARTADPVHYLYALCIPMCGRDVSKRLYHYANRKWKQTDPAEKLEMLLTDASQQCEEDNPYTEIEGIGPEKSGALIRWCRNPDNLESARNILKEVRFESSEEEERGTACEGLTFVITGELTHFHNRNELKEYIESQGGKVTGTVTQHTDYLINNDQQSTSNKNRKAAELKIPVINEEEFLRRYGMNNIEA